MTKIAFYPSMYVEGLIGDDVRRPKKDKVSYSLFCVKSPFLPFLLLEGVKKNYYSVLLGSYPYGYIAGHKGTCNAKYGAIRLLW